MYHPFLEGKRIYLRGIEKEDLAGPFFQWPNDKQVTRYLFMGAVPSVLENLQDWYEQLRKGDKEVVFMIVDKNGDRPIGFCGFHHMQAVHRSAEFRIFIGEKDYWGKGFGKESTQLMLRYGFELLNVNKIWLGVTSDNEKAMNSYLKCGFVKEGVLRQEIYRNNSFHDAVRMSILRSEYYEKCKDVWDSEMPNVFNDEK